MWLQEFLLAILLGNGRIHKYIQYILHKIKKIILISFKYTIQ